MLPQALHDDILRNHFQTEMTLQENFFFRQKLFCSYNGGWWQVDSNIEMLNLTTNANSFRRLRWFHFGKWRPNTSFASLFVEWRALILLSDWDKACSRRSTLSVCAEGFFWIFGSSNACSFVRMARSYLTLHALNNSSVCSRMQSGRTHRRDQRVIRQAIRF